MTNCVNCGAILRGNVCEYCGTKYRDFKEKSKADEPEFDAWTDSDGILHRAVIPKIYND